MDYGVLASLFWFMLGLLGLSLACIEIFSPTSADRIEEHMRKLLATLRGVRIVFEALIIPRRLGAREGWEGADRILTIVFVLLLCIVVLGLGLPLGSMVYLAVIGTLVFIVLKFDPLMHNLYIFAPGREIGALGLMISLPSVVRDFLELMLRIKGG